MRMAVFTSLLTPRVRMAAAVASVLAAAPTAPAQDAPWQETPWRAFVIGSFPDAFMPSSLAAGDLDGDGDEDVLAGYAHFGSPGVSVVLNRGDGTYLPPAHYDTGSGQTVAQVALADFDLDGDRDAFATLRGANDTEARLLVWRNDGGGMLVPPVPFATGQAPVGLVVADFTGDLKPDVVTANYAAGARSISLLRHNGQTGPGASFLPPADMALGIRVEMVAAADVNGDARLDLAVSAFEDGTAYVLILVNEGDGEFAPPVTYEAAPGAFPDAGVSNPVALRDLDNDGDADLIAGGRYDEGIFTYGAITIRRNDGQGAFGPHEAYRFAEFASRPWSLATADLNRDGFADVIAATPSGRTIDGYVVLPSTGGGSFGTPAYYEAEQWTYAAAAFDADGDRDVDVVTVAQSSAALTVHANLGDGSFRVLPRYALASITDGFDAADIDNDGDIDVVTNNFVAVFSNDAVIVVLKNDGHGVFTLAGFYTYPPPRNFAQIRLRDLNGDGFLDLLLAPDGNYAPYNFGSALNNGDGTFAPVVVHPVGTCGNGTIDAFDLDGDGDRDVVLTEEAGCPSVPLPRIFIFRNDGNQSFALVLVIESTDGFARGIEGADLNADGRLDMVTALAKGVGVYLNQGGFSFAPPLISSTSPYKFKLADVNADGKLDAAMVMSQDEVYQVDVATALGLGGGAFGPAQRQRGSNTAESLRISDDLDTADFNGDGRLDLLAFNYASNDLSVFLNAGDGTLLPQQRYGIGSNPQFGAVADFNGDGRPDVAASIGLPPLGWQSAMVVLRAAPSAALDLAVDAAGNLVFEPDETVVMAPTWRNTGTTPVAMTGGLSNFMGPAATYTIADGLADYGVIPPGAAAPCEDCYSLRVTAATRPALHWDATVLETAAPTSAAKTWHLHIGASFTDVPPSNAFYRFVETILHKDVTAGCAASAYCPGSSTIREQMAVFVLKAKEPPGYEPPACGSTPAFPDVPVSSPFCRWVEELARRGVVSGCGGGNYCPADAVTRAQMAVFVLRTLDPVLDPPACGTPMFADVPASSPFCRWIEELARRGVVSGCGGGNYCATAPVTREQMSVFLAVTFGLRLYGA